MYSLDDDVNNNQGSDQFGTGIFQPGVKIRFMNIKKNAGPLMFKVLPAFDQATMTRDANRDVFVPGDKRSFCAFRNEEGRLTPWARVIKTAGWIGHGSGRNGRRDFVGAKTFDNPSGGQVFCPMETLYNEAERDPEFSYLTKDIKEPATDKILERAALTPPKTQMIANVMVFDSTTMEVKVELGVFSVSGYNALLGRGDKPGLAHQINASISDPAYLAQNPMARWATGDLTHPTTGPTLVLSKGNDNGQYSGYTVSMAKDATGNVIRTAIPVEHLEFRHNLLDITSLVTPIDETKLITEELPKVLNGMSPNGTHEWVFLKKVFGHTHKIPEPPAMGGYTPGFSVAAPAPSHPPFPGAAAPAVGVDMSMPAMPTPSSTPEAGAPAVGGDFLPGLPSVPPPVQQPAPGNSAAPQVAPPSSSATPADPAAPGTSVPPLDADGFLQELQNEFPTGQ